MGDIVFVTGGSGFVGGGIIRALVSSGFHVRALARSHESARIVTALGAEAVQGDLTDEASLTAGMREANVVVHAAASLTEGISYRDHERTNVAGTGRVLDAARRAGVGRFVYISAASVVVDADRPTHGDEALPVRHHRSMPYSATKGRAERLVLDQNGPGLTTIALRPPFVWGEGAPAIAQIAKAFADGQFMWIGGGEFAFSVCHVDNLAGAVVRAVAEGQGGRAYFVTDDDTTSMRRFFSELIEATGHAAKARVMPYWLALLMARAMQLVFGLFGKQPPLSPEHVRMLGKRLELANGLAKQELGYTPLVSRAQGLERLRRSVAGVQGRAVTAALHGS